VALIGILGCAQTEPVQKLTPPVVVEQEPPQQTVEPNQRGEPPPAAPNLPEGSGVTAWAKEYVGQLIEGLDGNLYEPYGRSTIERVQKALGLRGLYAGPPNGILDLPTMKSIFAYQNANFQLQRCGIPTPHTRKMLEQGSHTDLGY
jgi:hypothetical protein